MDDRYEAPRVQQLGTIDELTRDGTIVKFGEASDAFTSIPPGVTGSNVTVITPPPVP